MKTIREIAAFLEAFAPIALAESWDNVGLLVGDFERPVERVMTCLTITPASAREAIDERAGLIVTHHPLPFRPFKQLTSSTPEGRMLLELIAAGIGIYSPHTAFDSAREGINQQLAEGLGLREVRVLSPAETGELGAGRFGNLPAQTKLSDVVAQVKKFLRVRNVQVVGALDRPVKKGAVACGSAGEFLTAARERGCDCLVTGEVRFHTALESETTGIALVLAGHFASERFAVESLAGVIAATFADLKVWPSQLERDPLLWT